MNIESTLENTGQSPGCDPKTKRNSGLFAFLKWFKPSSSSRESIDTDLQNSPSSSSCDSLNSTISNGTIASFSYINPNTYTNNNRIPEKCIVLGPETDTYKARLKQRDKRRETDKNLTLRKKYNLFFNRETLLKTVKKDEEENTKSLPLMTRTMDEEQKALHRRTNSESSKTKKAGAYLHVKGKRKAPQPPHHRPPSEGNSTLSLRRRKRLAPAPPSSQSVPPTTILTKLIGQEETIEYADIDTICNDSLKLEHGILKPAKEDSTSPTTSARSSCVDVVATPVSPRPWYKRNSRIVTEKSSKQDHKYEPIERLPEVQFMRNSTIDLTLDQPPLESPKIKEEKRKSGIAFLTNISELDREASEIIKREHEKNGELADIPAFMRPKDDPKINADSWVSPKRRSAKDLIAKFNAITNVTKVTVNSAFFGGAQKEVKRDYFGRQKQEHLLESHKKRIEQIDKKLNNLPLMKSESASAIKKPDTPKSERKNWNCPKCFLENEYWRIICHVCSAIKPYFDDLDTTPVKAKEVEPPKSGSPDKILERSKTQIGFSALASYNLNRSKKIEKSVSLDEKTQQKTVQDKNEERERLKKMLIEMKNSLPKRKSNILMKQNSRTSVIAENPDTDDESNEITPKPPEKTIEIVVATTETIYENIKVKKADDPKPISITTSIQTNPGYFKEERQNFSNLDSILKKNEPISMKIESNQYEAIAESTGKKLEPQRVLTKSVSLKTEQTAEPVHPILKKSLSVNQEPVMETTNCKVRKNSEPAVVIKKSISREPREELNSKPTNLEALKMEPVLPNSETIIEAMNFKASKKLGLNAPEPRLVLKKSESVKTEANVKPESQSVLKKSESVKVTDVVPQCEKLNDAKELPKIRQELKKQQAIEIAIKTEPPIKLIGPPKPNGAKDLSSKPNGTKTNLERLNDPKDKRNNVVPKTNFELMRPKDFETIYNDPNAQSPARIYANLARNDELSLFLNMPKKFNEIKTNALANASDKNTDTIEVNRLLRRLETAIAKGEMVEASSFAKELAQMKVNCSVIRQKSSEFTKRKGFNIEMYVEDKISHRGPFTIQVTADQTLVELKKQVEEEFEIPANVQRWILGKELATNDKATLKDHNITEGCPVFLYLVAPDIKNAAPKVVKMDSAAAAVSSVIVQISPKSKEDPPKIVEVIPKVAELQKQIRNDYHLPTAEIEKIPPPSTFTINAEVILSKTVTTAKAGEEAAGTSKTQLLPNRQPVPKEIGEDDLEDYDSKTLKPQPKEWECHLCTLLNPISSNICAVCATVRQKDLAKSNPRKSPKKKAAPQPQPPDPPVRKNKEETYLQLVNLDNADLVESTEPFACVICFLEIEKGNGVTLRECLHQFCKMCLAYTIEYNEDAEVRCPYRDDQYSCNIALQDREIKALVSPHVYEQHLAKSVSEAENKIGKSFHCKTPDCRGWCIFEDNVNEFRCPVCRRINCLTCQAIHTGLNCKQYQEKMNQASEVDEDAKRTKEMVDEMVRKGEALTCPTCQVILMKKWGCDWVRCSMCKTEICWVTRGPRWGPGGKGDTSGGCQCGVNGVKCHPQCSYCH